MLPFIIIGVVGGLFFGLLAVAAAGKLYHRIYWNRKRVTSDNIDNNNNRPSEDLELKQSSAAAAWLLCWRKASPPVNNNNNNVSGLSSTVVDEDVELGLGFNKSIVEEGGVEAELMRLHDLCGPPRFLFPIKEETLEDLASEEDGKPTSTRLIDLMRAADADFHHSPIASPVKKKLRSPLLYSNRFVNNPLFECSTEAELNGLMSSPPPKFKLLRDAEEKLQRKLEAEIQNVLMQQPRSEVVAVH